MTRFVLLVNAEDNICKVFLCFNFLLPALPCSRSSFVSTVYILATRMLCPPTPHSSPSSSFHYHHHHDQAHDHHHLILATLGCMHQIRLISMVFQSLLYHTATVILLRDVLQTGLLIL